MVGRWPIRLLAIDSVAQDVADLLTRGRDFNALAQFASAQRELDRALAVLAARGEARHQPLRARVLTTLALSTLALTGKVEAIALLDQARQTARECGDRSVLALTYVQEAAVHVWCADWEQALAALALAEDDLDLLTPREQVAAYLNRGLAHISVYDHGAGRGDLTRALDLACQHNLLAQEFKARHNLGCLEYFSGDIPRAIALMRQADEMQVEVDRSRALLDFAGVLIEAGLLDDAEETLSRARSAARSRGLALEEADIELDLTECAVLRGDLATARTRVSAAIAGYQSRGAADKEIQATLIAALIDLAEGINAGPSLELAEPICQAAGPNGYQRRLAARVVAEASLLLGDHAAARRSAAQFRRGRSAGAAAILHERLIQARLYAAEGDPARARRIIKATNDLLQRHQSRVHSLEIRAGIALHGRRLADFDTALALESGSHRAVFDSTERWRASSHRLAPLTQEPAVGSVGLVSELRRTRLRLMSADSSEAEQLRDHEAKLQREIAHRDWATHPESGVPSVQRPVGYDQVRALAHRTTSTVVTFFVADDSYYRLTISARGTDLRPLGLRSQVTDLSARLESDVRGAALAGNQPAMRQWIEQAVTASAQDLQAVVLADLDVQADEHIVIVPTHSLSTLPWGMMPALIGRPLIISSSVTRWASGTAVELARLTESTGATGAIGTGAIGAIGATAASREPAPPPALAALAGPGLPRASAECVGVRTAWDGTSPRTPSRPLASSRAVVTALAGARVVHLAAHGSHEEQNPLFSSLRMADGPVFAHELPRPVAAEHVVLSACDVGRSRIRSGDEPLGMTAALLSLGVGSVVAAVAPVADDAAEAAMVTYHRLLAGGTDAATALAQALVETPQARSFCLYGANWRRVPG